jgi:predicted transcriptional regulator
MRTLSIKIESDPMAALAQAGQAFAAAWPRGAYAGETLSFESPAALFRLLTPARWGVLAALQASGPCGLRPLARLLGRDASAVRRDVAALMARGLVEKGEDGLLLVPYGCIRAEFDMAKAA